MDWFIYISYCFCCVIVFVSVSRTAALKFLCPYYIAIYYSSRTRRVHSNTAALPHQSFVAVVLFRLGGRNKVVFVIYFSLKTNNLLANANLSKLYLFSKLLYFFVHHVYSCIIMCSSVIYSYLLLCRRCRNLIFEGNSI